MVKKAKCRKCVYCKGWFRDVIYTQVLCSNESRIKIRSIDSNVKSYSAELGLVKLYNPQYCEFCKTKAQLKKEEAKQNDGKTKMRLFPLRSRGDK